VAGTRCGPSPMVWMATLMPGGRWRYGMQRASLWSTWARVRLVPIWRNYSPGRVHQSATCKQSGDGSISRGFDAMPYKDAEIQRQYQREWQRARRIGAPLRTVRQTLNQDAPRTAAEVLQVLGSLIDQVLASDQGDIYIKARTVAYLAGVTLKAIETANIEERLAALEERYHVN
jgi:hypothetical protein